MPRIRLYPQDDGGITIPNPPGAGLYFPEWRLRVWVRVGGQYMQRQAILDTGSTTCIFSSLVWRGFHDRKLIEWVAHPPGTAARDLPRTTVLRGTYPFRLGSVSMQAVDLEGGELKPVPVLVQCTEDDRRQPSDPEPLPRLLVVGLGGMLNGRTLTLSVSADGTKWDAGLSE